MRRIVDMLKSKCVGCGLVAVALVSAPARAQDSRAAARDLVKKWQDAIVNVRVVVKMRMSMGGREMQSNDDTIEAVGTVIDPGGLTVVSLSSINPGPMMSKLIAGSGGGQNLEIASEPTDLKIRLPHRPGHPTTNALTGEEPKLPLIPPPRG